MWDTNDKKWDDNKSHPLVNKGYHELAKIALINGDYKDLEKLEKLMEDPKYYIPDIEEFHVGFEYEFIVLDNITGGHWFKFTCDGSIVLPYEEYSIQDDIDAKTVRVKYLDKEDIESLFNPLDILATQDKENGTIVVEILGNNLRENNRTLFVFVLTKLMWLMIYNKKTEIPRFSGTIKNKSELKKLLKQLNII